MIAQCKDQGFEVPVWRTTGNAVTVTFPGISVPFDYNEGISEGISEGVNEHSSISILLVCCSLYPFSNI